MNGTRFGFSTAQTATALLLVAAVCGHVLIALPRTAIPKETPALQLDPVAVNKVFAADRTFAAQAPTSPVALALDALLLEKGESERVPTETYEAQTDRKERTAYTLKAFRRDEGEPALTKLRARAVERMQDALNLKLPPEQVQGVLGGFPTILRETFASRDGVIVAPDLVVRALYKVRWNVIVGLPPLFALEPVERLAYHGWFGLHVSNGPLQSRVEVLRRYAADGGYYVNESLGMLGYVGGEPAAALAMFERADAMRPSYRLRNLMRSAKRADYTMRHSPRLSPSLAP